ncbi:hypothetical protein FMEAI12_4230011 [Parafrankia sp. Ea1.12]|nr:hypothetical protein FMEAI12_4230011 [Parafrankia sp. Ea1.12]
MEQRAQRATVRTCRAAAAQYGAERSSGAGTGRVGSGAAAEPDAAAGPAGADAAAGPAVTGSLRPR